MKTKFSTDHPLKLYTDGGVIQKNPSAIGGTWAWCIVLDGQLVIHKSGVILPTEVVTFPDNVVTNNQTELYAIVDGLHSLMENDVAQICSDSLISLNRVFNGSSFSNIPSWLIASLDMAKSKLVRWNEFSYKLMNGHPTKKELADGMGKRGYPTSKWNVLCDRLCNIAGQEYVESL